MPELVTIEEAKGHLRITSDSDNPDLAIKLEAATQVIIDYLTRRDEDWNAEMEAWTPDTVPSSIRAAVLVQLGELYRKRGDDPDVEQRPTVSLSTTVMSLLMRYRDPGFA